MAYSKNRRNSITIVNISLFIPNNSNKLLIIKPCRQYNRRHIRCNREVCADSGRQTDQGVPQRDRLPLFRRNCQTEAEGASDLRDQRTAVEAHRRQPSIPGPNREEMKIFTFCMFLS